MTEQRSSKKQTKRPKSLPQLAWEWRDRRLPGADYATLAVVEEAYIAGARAERRRGKR